MSSYDETLQRYNVALAAYREAIIDVQRKYHTDKPYDDFKERCSESECNAIEALRKACEDAYQEHYETL